MCRHSGRRWWQCGAIKQWLLLGGGITRVDSMAPVLSFTVNALQPGPSDVNLAHDLQKQKIPATFFIPALSATLHKTQVRDIKKAGHQIGLLITTPLPEDAVLTVREIRHKKEYLEGAVGGPVFYVRSLFPMSPVVESACRNEGLIDVGYQTSHNIMPGDIYNMGKDVSEVVRKARQKHMRWVSLEELFLHSKGHKIFCLGGMLP